MKKKQSAPKARRSSPPQVQNAAPPPMPKEVQNEASHMIKNGLSEAILGFNPGSIGVQLSQVDTLFKNNRWYLISNMRQVLSEIYVEHGLVQTIVDVPVDDGLRGGVDIKSKQLAEEQIAQLRVIMERSDILSSVVGRALKWNRLFGGAGIIIMTDQDPTQPFDIKLIKEDSPLEFRAVDMWELYWTKQNVEGYDAEIQMEKFEHYNYYAKKIHKSRVMKMVGMTAPSFIRPRLRGWGFSIVEPLVRSINQYLKSNDLTFEVLDEFKLDIFKIKNLAQTLMSAEGTELARRRIQLANQQKNYQNAMTMDAEDDYIQKQLTFAGLADMMKEFRMQIASDMRMPISKIFGISSTGFSSGEDDIENYNAMVESQVREKCKYDILRIIELLCQKHFGMIPDDLEIDFHPLRMLSAEQEENVRTQKFARLLQARQAGEIDSKEFRDACNKENLLSVQLDTSDLAMEELEQGQAEDAAAESGAVDPNKDPGDEGANAGTTAKSAPLQDEDEAPDSPESAEVEDPDEVTFPKLEDDEPKSTKNSAQWEESKHPRADDGKFGSGSGSAGGEKEKGKKPEAGEAKPAAKKKAAPKKEKAAPKGEAIGIKAFKGFTETQEPTRSGSRTTSAADLCKYSGANAGRPSDIQYASPKGVTANLVGHVAFGKASLKAQKELNEILQSSEIILSDLGVKFKTPLDFVCQNIASAKNTMATYAPFTSKGTVNPRIDIKSKADLSKSILHEIGHAIDYALSDREGYPSSSIHAGKTAGTGAPSPELQKVHKELSELFEGSDFFKAAPADRVGYLSKPTEQFARAFEVYSYGKAKELSDAGKIPASVVETFRPDMFKKRGTLIFELRDAASAIARQFKVTKSSLAGETDPAKKEELTKQLGQLKSDYDAAFKTFDDLQKKTQGFEPIAEDKQKEYIEKVTAIMKDLFSKDSVKNALERVGLFTRMTGGIFE